MAVTVIIYNRFKRRGQLPVELALDTLKLCLLSSTYTPNLDTHEFYADLTGELGATGGYTAGGQAVGGLIDGLDTAGDFAYLDGDNVTWLALTPSVPIRYAVLYNTTDSNRLIQLIDFGSDQDPDGEDFPVSWASPASGGILKVV